MRILKLSPYCYPEQVSSSHLTHDLNQAFFATGMSIVNFVPTPTRGVSKDVRQEYKHRKHEVRDNGKNIIHRFAMFGEGKNPILRAIRYVLVNVIQYFKGSHAKEIDAIYAGSTPPTQGVLCAMVKKTLSKKTGKSIPFIYNLQDVFPDSLVTAGFTHKGSLLWKIGRKVENYTYQHADKIIVISQDIKENIMSKGVSEEKIQLIYNWIDTDKVRPIGIQNNQLYRELGLSESTFKVVYAGNLGKAQGVQVLVEVADRMQDDLSVEFIIFGSGVEEENIKTMVSNKGLRNIRVLPLQPAERISEVYSLGDVSVVACKKGAGGGAVPSKTFSIMATATPVLLSFDEGSELWHLIEENDCGYTAPAGDAEGLAERIREAKNDLLGNTRKGSNARALVLSRFSKQVGTQAYTDVILEEVERIKVV